MTGRRGPNRIFSVIESDVTPVASPIVLTGVDTVRPHCFAGVQFFADAQGTIPAVPGAGTVAVTVQTINTAPVSEIIPDNVIDATAPTTLSWAANTQQVTATPTGITVATHYRLVVSCNET